MEDEGVHFSEAAYRVEESCVKIDAALRSELQYLCIGDVRGDSREKSTLPIAVWGPADMAHFGPQSESWKCSEVVCECSTLFRIEIEHDVPVHLSHCQPKNSSRTATTHRVSKSHMQRMGMGRSARLRGAGSVWRGLISGDAIRGALQSSMIEDHPAWYASWCISSLAMAACSVVDNELAVRHHSGYRSLEMEP